MKVFQNWNWFEKIWLIMFCSIAAILSYVWGDNWFGYSVFLTGVICVVLVAKGSIWNYAWGIYNVIGYSWLSYQNGFFGELTLNAGYFLPMQFIGFYMWRNKIADKVVTVRQQTKNQFLLSVSGAIVATGIYGYILSLIPSQNSPYLDSMSTVLSVIAMVLMAMRYYEQWGYWIVINVVSIIMWSMRLGSGVEGAVPMISMWSAYLVNAVYGYYKWNKLYKEQ